MSMEKKAHIVFVDKTKKVYNELKPVLADCYEMTLLPKGKDVIDYLHENSPDVVLLHTNITKPDAFEVLTKMQEDNQIKGIPVVLLSDEKDTQYELKGLQAGAMEVVSLPLEPIVLKVRMDHLVELTMARREQEDEIAKQKEQNNRLALQSILTIAHTVDTKDRYGNKHSVRVALYCREIAKRLGYNEKQTEDLYYMALLHDIGKIAVEDSILNKASELTDEEYEAVKKHTTIGAQIVKDTKFIPGVEEAVKNHHEWYNGAGYRGIKGNDIPESARIIAVADAYEVMSSDQAYRRKLPKDRVMEELILGRGTQFDPYIVDAFLELLEEGLSIDEESVERELEPADGITEAGALLRQVFTESVQETQNELEKDSLTGFLNRKYFEEKINNYLLQPKSRGTFFMMDLDNFKMINDTYGHASGDELIRIFADVLRANTREKDFVCRIGGDEFAIFYPEMDKDHVIIERAENIIKMFAEKKQEAGYGICSVSIGIMTKYLASKEMDYDSLYEKADKALYYVKNNGKDDYYHYAYMSEEADEAGQSIKELDLKQLMRQLAARKYRKGAYAVEYDRFAYIYQFITRNIERSKQHVQIILVTLEIPDGLAQPLVQIEDSLMLLETAIVRSLRRGDVTTRFSSTQQIIVLMDTNPENGKMVADRIMTKFADLSSGSPIKAHFDITEVPVNKEDKWADI